MPVLSAALLDSCIAVDANPALSSDLLLYAVDYWPPHNAIVNADLTTVTTQLPVSTTPRVLQASITPSYLDDYYFRIHYTPTALPVGNVVTDQVREQRVWNAYFEPKTLQNIVNANADGIALPAEFATPRTFNALEEVTGEITVLQNGPPIVNVNLGWQFTGITDYTLAITGVRVTAWTFHPNWESGIREQLEWLTDVLASKTNREQRRALRAEPRRNIAFDILVNGVDRARLDLALYSWGARYWALPIFNDVQWLSGVAAGSDVVMCNTEYSDFRDAGLAILIGDGSADYEVIEIDTVESDRLLLKKPLINDWPYARLFPLRTARLVDQPNLQRLTDDLVQSSVEFILTDADWPELVTTLYRSFPVIDKAPDESDELTLTYNRLLNIIDNGTGELYQDDYAGVASHIQSYGWLLEGAADRANWRSLFYTLRGRQGAVWIPTFMQDLNIVAVQTDSIDITNIDYGRFISMMEGRRDVRIELNDGTVFMRRITASVVVDSNTERLALDSSITPLFIPADVCRASWMALCRLDSDRIELHHITDNTGCARATAVFRGVRDEP